MIAIEPASPWLLTPDSVWKVNLWLVSMILDSSMYTQNRHHKQEITIIAAVNSSPIVCSCSDYLLVPCTWVDLSALVLSVVNNWSNRCQEAGYFDWTTVDAILSLYWTQVRDCSKGFLTQGSPVNSGQPLPQDTYLHFIDSHVLALWVHVVH